MPILNFSHPLTDAQVVQLETLLQIALDELRNIAVQLDVSRELVPQTIQLVESLNISSDQWQEEAWLMPSLNFIAAILLAELYGRMGRFPSIVRLRPVANSLVSTFEVAEIISPNF